MMCWQEAEGLSQPGLPWGALQAVLASDTDIFDQECFSHGYVVGLWPTRVAEC